MPFLEVLYALGNIAHQLGNLFRDPNNNTATANTMSQCAIY